MNNPYALLYVLAMNVALLIGGAIGYLIGRLLHRVEPARPTLLALDGVGGLPVASGQEPLTNPHADLIQQAPEYSPDTVRRGVASLERAYREAGMVVPCVERLEQEALQVLNYEEVG